MTVIRRVVLEKGKWKIFVGGNYPYGAYMGSFSTKEEAEMALKEHSEEFQGGIPLCSALVDWRRDHGMSEAI